MFRNREICGPPTEEVRQSAYFSEREQHSEPYVADDSFCSTCLRGPRLRLLHFNDVYDVYPAPSGVGGAAHLATAMKEKKEEDADDSCLVFFSGDIFSPSQLSEASRGRNMAYVLNLLEVHTACYGNHDLDYGSEWLEVLAGTTTCKWIVSNASTKGNEEHPLGNAQKYRIFEWGPHRVLTGIVGLIERDWIDLLPPAGRSTIVYEDYVQAGRKYVSLLRKRGCQLVIALTHMRWHNDEKLAQEVDDIDLILGGHDHEYGVKVINGRLIVKSGSDFRDFSSITLFPKSPSVCTGSASVKDSMMFDSLHCHSATDEDAGARGNQTPHLLKTLRRCGPARKCNVDFRERDEHSFGFREGMNEEGKETVASSPGRGKREAPVHEVDARSKDYSEEAMPSTAASSEHSSNVWTKSPDPEISSAVERVYSSGRWWASCARVPVSVNAYAADKRVVRMLANCERDFCVNRNTETLGSWPVLVEARFREIRTRDCNSGRWVADLVRSFADADVGIICAGSIRADCVFQEGEVLKACTLQEMLQCARKLRTIAVRGSLFTAVLENSVSRWPQLEGRFLQVSGLRFVFDGNKPPGERVFEHEISVYDRPSNSWVKVDPDKLYKVIGSVFLIEGGDGYTMLSDCEKVAVGKEGVEEDVLQIAKLWWERRRRTATCGERVGSVHPSEKPDGMEWLDQVRIEEESDPNWRIRNVACGDVLDNTFPSEEDESGNSNSKARRSSKSNLIGPAADSC